MNVMYIRHKLGGISPLHPTETLVHARERVQAVTTRCAHGRGIWAFPFVTAVTLYVTNRRISISCCVFPCYRQELDLWFPVEGLENAFDTIVSISCDTGQWGPCIHIQSEVSNRRRSFFSAPELVTRVYCDDAEDLERIIRRAMTPDQACNG